MYIYPNEKRINVVNVRYRTVALLVLLQYCTSNADRAAYQYEYSTAKGPYEYTRTQDNSADLLSCLTVIPSRLPKGSLSQQSRTVRVDVPGMHMGKLECCR